MTPRQARTQRREAERKAAKLARKAEKAETVRRGFVSQNDIVTSKSALVPQNPATLPNAGFVSQNPATLPNSGFDSQNAPAPANATPPSPDPVAERRREINRANAAHSSGPRTPAGKLASSRNSLKHGLASGELIIPGEDRAAFEALLNNFLIEHQPANPTEELLVNEMAQAYWLTQRAIYFQNACFTDAGVDDKRIGSLGPVVRVDDKRTGRLGPVVRVDDKRLSLFLRYQVTHDRRFYKALHTLISLKKNRARQQAAPACGFVPQNARHFRKTPQPPLQTPASFRKLHPLPLRTANRRLSAKRKLTTTLGSFRKLRQRTTSPLGSFRKRQPDGIDSAPCA